MRVSGRHTVLKRAAVLLLLALVLNPCRQELYAQTRAQRAGNMQKLYPVNFGVNLVPLPLFFNGFRVDFDARLKDNLWLQVVPQYNYKRTLDYDKLDGFCAEFNLRWYVFHSDAKGFYISGGMGVDYNRIQESEQIFDGSEDASGMILPEESVLPIYKVNAFRLGGQFNIGYQFGLWPRATMDFYVGAAFRRSFNSFADPASEYHMMETNIRPWMYNFSGLYLQAGIRIGILL